MSKVALVTGGNSGIGFATCKLFKEKGYTVFLSGRNPERVKQAAQELGVEYLIADMGNPHDIQALASNFLKDGLDVLINNAAIAKFKSINELTEEDFSECFNINVRGPMLLIKEMLPALEKQQGSIVNVSSIIVDNGVPNYSLYAATKGALDSLTRSLALELAPRKIRINIVSPGAIDTPIFTKVGLSKEKAALLRSKREILIPLSRYGNPEEVAAVIAAQAESTYVTGSVWKVDGGVDVS